MAAALLPLLVGAIVVVASSRPAPEPDGAVLAATGMPSSGLSAAAGSGSSTNALSPILETRRTSTVPSRPDVAVPRPSVGSVRQATSSRKPTVRALAPVGARAVYLGDSYTTGWNGAGLGSRGWPKRVGAARGWRTVNLAVAGTGFINPGWTNEPIRSRVAAAIKQDPDVVFLAGGHNDSRWSAAATARAADKVIDRLRAALPDAVLVIVAPIWPSGSPPARCLSLRDHLRRKAAAVGAIFIDPLGEKWFAGTYHRLIGADGIHPTDAGHRRIADRVLADLAKAD